ncbi:MAG: YybH family protein [Pyrinomonadaceae bacterium]
MTLNRAQSEEAVMDNLVGKIKRGWEEIKPVYEQIFNSPAQVSVEFYDYSLHQAEDIFYVTGRERGELKIGETVIDLAIRTSRIFKLTGGEWKQIHHHGSIDNPELLARYQQAVKGK